MYGFGLPRCSRHGRGGRRSAEGRATRSRPTVIVLEAGVVGSLDYKIIEAGRADDLFKWLKDNKYSYSGDEATLNHYMQKKWLFTVMKIDTMQMKRNKDGTFDGEVTPTRFQFASEKLVYPLKITQISVREKTEALFYVQAPLKVDLQGDMTYQYMWVPMLQARERLHAGRLAGPRRQTGSKRSRIRFRRCWHGPTNSISASSAASVRSRITRATSPPRWNGPAS